MKLRNITIVSTLALSIIVSAQATSASAAPSTAATHPGTASGITDGTSNTVAYGHRPMSYTFNDLLITG